MSVVPDGKLVYGIQLPVQALSINTSMPWEQDATVDDLRRAAVTADGAGFFYVAICDHVAIPREKAEMMSTTWFNPVATLGWIAGQTHQARLMTNVYVAAYRHPLETAKMFATLDHLSRWAGDPRRRRGPRRGRVRGARHLVRGSWPADERGDRRHPRRRGRTSTSATSASGPGRRSSRARRSGSVDRRSRRSGASPSGATAGSRRARPKKLMPESIEYLHEHRDKVRPGEPIEVGMITEYLYVGDAGLGAAASTRAAARRSTSPRSSTSTARSASRTSSCASRPRSIDELCDQMARFGDEVGPHLTR